MDFAALQRLISGTDPLEVLQHQQSRQQTREVEEVEPFPDDPVEFIRRHVFWPHISEFDSTGAPRAVGGDELNEMQIDYLERRTSFRYGANGQPIGSSGDLVVKARRIRFSSLCYGLILHTMIRLSGVSALTVFQAQKAALLEGALDQILFAMRRIPRQWLDLAEGEDPSVLRVGHRIRFRNRSTWALDTAGHHKRVSATLGRGMANLQVLHLTEPRAYHEPEIVYSSAAKGVGNNGWIIAESNPPTAQTNWMAEEYMLTAQEPPSGSFQKCFFWPWFQDPLKRIKIGTAGFDAMHDPKFVSSLPPGTVDEERALGLDVEQIAFRRRDRFTGTKLQRRLNLAENPESVDECYQSDDKRWLDSGAIELCRAMCSEPLERYRLGTLHSVSYWMTPEEVRALNEQIICFVDTAAKHGIDRSAAVFRSALTCRYIAEIHGKCLASEMADSLVHVLETLLGSGAVRRPTRYLIAVERNAGTGKDLLDHLRNRHNMRVGTKNGLYSEQVADRRPQAQKGQRKLRPGIFTGSATRSSYLAALSDGIEGRGFDVTTGEITGLAPTVEWRSSYAIDEIEALCEHDGLIQAPPGKGSHDDLAIANGGVLMLCSKFGKKLHSGGFSSGGARRSTEGFSRSGKKVRRARRKFRPE